MPRFTECFGFSAHPFERYVAESEPEIQAYAVTPPYFEETKKRTASTSSFILFGFRGSGKSATRLTSEKEAWTRLRAGEKSPLVVSFTDFEPIIEGKKVEDISANVIIAHVAFLVVEAILLWISNQEEGDLFLEMLNEQEKKSFVSLVKAHYLPISNIARKISVDRTMDLLHQKWYNKTIDWIGRKWDPISVIVSKIVSSAGEKHLELDLPARELHEILKTNSNYTIGISVIKNLVECARSFGFSGICLYVDKVDETTKTGNSSEVSARLVHPILSQVQLLEISGFAWVFFLWDKIKGELSQEPLRVRLDKYAFSEITWDKEFLKKMVNQRLKYFSSEVVSDGQFLCASDVDFDTNLDAFIDLVSLSPRELVRILDVLVREYDTKYALSDERHLLTDADFIDASNSYVRNVVWTIYDKKILSEILRLGRQRFINKDVQELFRISDQGARNRIRNWIASGAVRQAGTTAGETETGGKPANVYTIADPRIALMMERNLFDGNSLIVEAPVGDESKDNHLESDSR